MTRYLAVPLELRDLAVSLAQSAGRQLLTMRQSMLVTETKSSGSDWVSNADRAVEDRLVGMLTDTRPCDGILGEERTTRQSTSGLTWIIDPLDGTTNYLRGYPGWSVSVAVEAGGSPLAGAVHDPSTSMTYAAAADRGATLNGSTLNVSGCAELVSALIGTGVPTVPRSVLARLSGWLGCFLSWQASDAVARRHSNFAASPTAALTRSTRMTLSGGTGRRSTHRRGSRRSG